MDTNWLERSKNNLLPYSETNNFREALTEWFYTGYSHDLEIANQQCDLCEHPNIRYQFEIENKYNGHTLLVGSECINKFNILSIDKNGEILNAEHSRNRVNQDKRDLIKKAKERLLINKIVELAQKDNQFNITDFIDYYKERKAFTPKQLSTLIWRMEKANISYEPKIFKMTIRREREQYQLMTMPNWQIQKIYPMMTTSQKKWVEDNTKFQAA